MLGAAKGMSGILYMLMRSIVVVKLLANDRGLRSLIKNTARRLAWNTIANDYLPKYEGHYDDKDILNAAFSTG